MDCLNKAAFDTSLNELDQKRLYDQIDYIKANVCREQEHFEKEAQDLFLMDIARKDESYIEERKSLQKLLEMYIKVFIKKCLPKTKVKEIQHELIVSISIEDKQKLLLELTKLEKKHIIDKRNASNAKFRSLLGKEEVEFALCFDNATIDESVQNHIVIDVNNPLVKLAQDLLDNNLEHNNQCSLVSKSDILPKGNYLFGCFDWHEYGYKRAKKVKVLLLDSNNSRVEISTHQFEELLGNANTEAGDNSIQEDLLESLVYEEYVQAKKKLLDVNNGIIQRKLATSNEFFERKILDCKRKESSATDSRIKKLYAGKARNLIIKWEEQKDRINDQKNADIISNLFLSGTLRIE